MLHKGLIFLLLAGTALPALAGDLILSVSDTSIPKAFSCGESKKLLAGRYTLDVIYEQSPTAHSVLKVSKGGKPVCSVEGSGTTLHEKMTTSKTRLFTRVDPDRKAFEIVVITPTEMRGKVRNQVFYLPLIEAE
jgi:hypothetical protein